MENKNYSDYVGKVYKTDINGDSYSLVYISKITDEVVERLKENNNVKYINGVRIHASVLTGNKIEYFINKDFKYPITGVFEPEFVDNDEFVKLFEKWEMNTASNLIEVVTDIKEKIKK